MMLPPQIMTTAEIHFRRSFNIIAGHFFLINSKYNFDWKEASTLCKLAWPITVSILCRFARHLNNTHRYELIFIFLFLSHHYSLLMITTDVAFLGILHTIFLRKPDLGHLGTEKLAAASLAAVWTGLTSNFMYYVLLSLWVYLIFVDDYRYGAPYVLNTLCAQAYGAKNYKLLGIW